MKTTKTVLTLASIVVLSLLVRRMVGGSDPAAPEATPDSEV